MRAVLEKLLAGEHLPSDEAESVMGQIMEGKVTPVQAAALLAALRAKGETVPEILGFARAMRRRLVPVPVRRRPLVDTCGTGGDGANTFNISTTVSFVLAGAGAAVAKHGNRAASSKCGAADVLEALGAKLDLAPQRVGEAIDTIGVGFIFARNHHPAMKQVAPVRGELGVRTVFNLMGPLTNPAGATRQLLGVFDPVWTEPLAQVLKELGAERAMVVHGQGLDELALSGPSRISELRDGYVTTYRLDPERFGLRLAPVAAIAGGSPQDNAALVQGVLSGERGPRRDVVLLNAAAALVVAGVADDLESGLTLAARSIDTGTAKQRLEQYIQFSNG